MIFAKASPPATPRQGMLSAPAYVRLQLGSRLRRAIAFLAEYGVPPPESIIPDARVGFAQFPDIRELWTVEMPPAPTGEADSAWRRA